MAAGPSAVRAAAHEIKAERRRWAYTGSQQKASTFLRKLLDATRSAVQILEMACNRPSKRSLKAGKAYLFAVRCNDEGPGKV